jgi:hypothetical protein
MYRIKSSRPSKHAQSACRRQPRSFITIHGFVRANCLNFGHQNFYIIYGHDKLYIPKWKLLVGSKLFKTVSPRRHRHAFLPLNLLFDTALASEFTSSRQKRRTCHPHVACTVGRPRRREESTRADPVEEVGIQHSATDHAVPYHIQIFSHTLVSFHQSCIPLQPLSLAVYNLSIHRV